MAANQPVLLQRSMVDGVPDEGILPCGQVAAAIGDLKSCQDLIEEMVQEAVGDPGLAAVEHVMIAAFVGAQLHRHHV